MESDRKLASSKDSRRSYTAAEAADVLGPLQSIGFGSFPSDLNEEDLVRWFKVGSGGLKKGLPEVEGVPLQMWGLKSLMGPLGVHAKLSASSGVNLEWRAAIALSKWSVVWLKHGTLPDALRMWVAAAAQSGHALSGDRLLAEDRQHVLKELGIVTKLMIEAVQASKTARESDPFALAVLKAVEPNTHSWPLEFQEQWGRTLVSAAGMLVHALDSRVQWSSHTSGLAWRLLETGASLISTAAPDVRRRGVGSLFCSTSALLIDSVVHALNHPGVHPLPPSPARFSESFMSGRPLDVSLWTTLGVVIGEASQGVDMVALSSMAGDLPPIGHPVMDMMLSWNGGFSGWLRQSYLTRSLDSGTPSTPRPRL